VIAAAGNNHTLIEEGTQRNKVLDALWAEHVVNSIGIQVQPSRLAIEDHDAHLPRALHGACVREVPMCDGNRRPKMDFSKDRGNRRFGSP
jgi:hypothetical protein